MLGEVGIITQRGPDLRVFVGLSQRVATRRNLCPRVEQC
jgi:hypothetical protein